MFVDVAKVTRNSDFMQNLDKGGRKSSIKEVLSFEDRGYTESDLHFEKSNDFSASSFVDRLLTEGCDAACDDSSASFNKKMQLPPYYDKKLYKSGQNFFFKHIFGLFLSKMLGLLLLLKLPTIKILIMTNMSETPLKAYRRYLATVFHMCIWYWEDLEPGSKLFNSIHTVKTMHNSASRKGKSVIDYNINQKDMALTQFGFMGFALVRNKMMGIHDATEEEWKAFVHVWRVIGYILGIEDKYNICRESLTETRAICNELIEKVFIKAMQTPDDNFVRMSRALVEGMWVMNPMLQHDVFVYYLHMTLENSGDINRPRGGLQIEGRERLRLKTIILVVWSLQYTIVRLFYKYVQLLSLWLMKEFPFLAYYRFGRANSGVVVNGF